MSELRTRVVLCGSLRVEIDGRDVSAALPGGQTGLLACYLLASPGRAADRDELVALLWPEAAPKDPGAALRPVLSRLRRALAPATLEGRERLRLALPEPVWVDVEAAAHALAEARAAAQERRWAGAREQAGVAAAILRPGLLPALDGEWLQAARWEHEEHTLEALELVARSGAALGGAAAADAERASRELISRSPFRESGYRKLMEALAARGNAAEALRVYERLRVLLRDELGVAPAADLQALHLRLLSGADADPARVQAAPVERPAAADALPAALAVRSTLPFAGRADELATLRELLAEPSGRVALVGGDAGTGKSRLVREFAREAADSGALVLHGACDVMVRAPYGPFVEALDHLVRVTDPAALREALGPTAVELLRLLPALQDVLGTGAAPVDADPDTERHRLHTAVADLLTATAAARPLLVVVEDAHWADAPSLALLRHVARAVAAAPLVVVITFRDTDAELTEAVAETLADLRRAEAVVRLALEGLTGAEVGQFVAAAAGAEAGAAELAAAIDTATGGNAFLVCELWRALAEGEALEVTSGGVRLRRPLAELAVPDSVREVAERRLARLAPETRALLEVAAVAGSEFELDALRQGGEPLPVAALDEAVRSGVLEELPSARLAYRFAHELLRRAIHDGASRIRRAELHERVGEALERAGDRSARRLADLAYHFTQAAPVGGTERGIGYSVLAARAARAALAFDEAVAHLEAALELSAGDLEERTELLLELGEAAHRAGRAPVALDAFREAAGLGRERGDATQLARAAVGYEDAAWRPGIADDVAVSLLEDAARALGDAPSRLRVRVLGSLARALEMRGEEEHGGSARTEAIATARALNDPAGLAGVLVSAIWAGGAQTHEQTLADLSEARDLAIRLGDRELQVEAMCWRIEALLRLCRVDAAEREAAAARALAEQTAQPFHSHVAAGTGAAIALSLGKLAEAETLAGRADEWSRGLTGHDASGVYGVQMFGIRREQGRLAELAPLVRVLAARGGAWRPGLAALLVELDMADEARAVLARVAADGLEPLRETLWLASLAYLADAAAAVGDDTMAATLYKELAPLAGQNLLIGHVVACHGAADRHLGMLAATFGDGDRASAHYERALALNRRMGARTWLAHTAYHYGRALLEAARADARGRAIALLDEAEALAAAVGMPALRRRVAGLAQWALPDGLAFRDAHVLVLIAAGATAREIGDELGLGEDEAAELVRAVLEQTGCATRRDAASLAEQLGLASA